MIKLHKRVLDAVQDHHRCQAQWRALINKAFYLEDVDLAEATHQLPPKWTTIVTDLPTSAKFKRSGMMGGNDIVLPHPMRYAWHITLKRPVFMTFGVICAAMTCMIMWSECTFFVIHPQLSIAARILHSAARGYHYKYIQICAVFLILYLGVCAYYTIFRLRIYRYYHLDPNQMTDENSLIFSAMLLCRLTSPLCLNFLGMIHLDSHITSDAKFGVETQFTKLMGHLDVIPLLAKGINIYLPMFIVLLALGTWFRLGTRLLHYLGIDQFLDEDEMTADMIQGGKSLVTLERNRINRERNREERNRGWTNSKNTQSSYKKQPDTQIVMEYSDRDQLIQHQDNNAMFDDYIQPANASLLTALEGSPSSARKTPSLADLEFGTAFDASSQSLQSATYSKKNGEKGCPSPSSIFDDL
ncbi:LMBR1-like membrane protein [Ditylenchus destructor]|nr:LMBR1-like membrane protein [Ditylenchus destructor]